MRTFTIILLLFSSAYSLYSQTQKESINTIKQQFAWINSQTNYEIVELNNEDYLDHTPDNGGQLKGYFKNDTLYKIVEWVSPSYAIMITEYYLWEEELFFVYDIEKNFGQIIDSVDGFLGFDYNIVETKYESRHYFVDKKEIKQLETGERLMDISTSNNFVSNTKRYLQLLLEVKEN